MKGFISTIVLGGSFLKSVMGITDTLAGIPACLPDSPLTAFPECHYFFNATDVCGNFDKQERLVCLCNQRLFDSIIG